MTETQSRSLFDPAIMRPALIASLAKLDPRGVPQPGDVRGRDRRWFTTRWLADPGVRRTPTRGRRRAGLVHVHRRGVAVAHCRVRKYGRGAGRGPRKGPGREPARDAHRDGRASRRRPGGRRRGARARRRRGCHGRRGDPRRRHCDRGHRLRRRVRNHGRVRARDPGSWRRPLGGHGWHPRAVGPDRGRDHAGAREELPRPHDRARRRRRRQRRTRSRSTFCSPASRSCSSRRW